MKKHSLFLIIFALLSQFIYYQPPLAKAVPEEQTWNFTASASAYVSNVYPTTNYGTGDAINAKYYSNIEHIPFIKFNLSSIPKSQVFLAKLKIKVKNPSDTNYCRNQPDSGWFQFVQNSGDWNERTLTWLNKPGETSVYDPTPASSFTCTADWIYVDMTSVVQDWVNGTHPNYGIRIYGTPIHIGDWARTIYSSRSAYPPQMSVEFLDSYPPQITSMQISDISKTSAKVTWATDESTTTNLKWGRTTSYGSMQGFPAETKQYTIPNLSPGTTYHVQVISFDNFGNSTASSDHAFTTLSDTSSGNSGGNSGGTSSTAKPASQVVKPVDTSIPSPTLEYVELGSEKITAPVKNKIVLPKGQSAKLVGKSFPAAKIAIIVGDKAFTGDANQSGSWEVTINSAEFAEGDYKVKAQAQDMKKNKGSPEVEFFDLAIQSPSTVSPTPKAKLAGTGNSPSQSFIDKLKKNFWKYYFIFAPLFVIIAVAIYLIKQRRKRL